MDTTVATESDEKPLQTFVNREELSRFVIYADNLTGQQSDKFKQAISKLKGCVSFALLTSGSLLAVALLKP